MRSLAADGKSPAVSDPTVGADVHEPLDVHRDFGAQRALDAEIALDELAQPVRVGVVQVAHALGRINAGLGENLPRGLATDAIDVGKADLELLLAWQIHARNTRHSLTLPLLVLRVALADDPCDALPLDHLAVLADWLDAAPNFHSRSKS